MKFEKYLNYFKDYLITKNFSERTISTYTHEIKKFLSFIEENYIRIKLITQITKDTIFDYMNYLTCYKDRKGNSLSTKTIKIKIISIKNFFNHLGSNSPQLAAKIMI